MPDESPSTIKFIDREMRKIDINLSGLDVSFPLNAIPDKIYETIVNTLEGARDTEEKIRKLYDDTLMKPTVSTQNATGIFPINSAKKIVRLTLTDEALEDRILELEGVELSFQGHPFDETIEERIELYQKVMLDDHKIDRFRLGAVEMYGDVTYHNIRRDPRVSLNFFWSQEAEPESQSYQINCIAEIVPPGDPFFRYMRIMRRLFSSRLLDLRGTEDYICAYKFWVCETKEKSLTEKAGYSKF
ncbi:MAG: pyridoxamine 5'-phosphate oxidase family protein [Candidatus Thorarchaeota archaeon]